MYLEITAKHDLHTPKLRSHRAATGLSLVSAPRTCIEDAANLQHSEPVRRILGACRIPA
jgi:hypothetical protein